MVNKVIVITGGSSGIGKALAREFGKRGSKVVITGRRLESLRATAIELKNENIDVFAFAGDAASPEDNARLAEEAVRHFGKIDILINNAGVSMRALFQELDTEVIRRVMEVNFFGAVTLTKLCLPELIKNKGSIVGISSAAGFRGLPGRTGYSASKFALNGFLEALRTELRQEGVHVLTACPGYTASDIRKNALTKDGSPQAESPRDENKMMSAEECAAHIYKAVKKRKALLILTWKGKLAVWMNRFFPTFTDWLVLKEMEKEKQ